MELALASVDLRWAIAALVSLFAISALLRGYLRWASRADHERAALIRQRIERTASDEGPGLEKSDDGTHAR